MSGANYEYCPVCDMKAWYIGDDDVPDDLIMVHAGCLDAAKIRRAADERGHYLPALRTLSALAGAAP